MCLEISPCRQCEVKGLVVHADCHDADEPEDPDAIRIGAGHGQGRTVRNLLRPHRPALDAIHGRRVRRDHRPDRAGHCRVLRPRLEARAAVDLLGVDMGSERHIVHVDEVLTQPLHVDAASLRLRIRLQLQDDLLYRREGRLPSLQEIAMTCVRANPMALVRHTGRMVHAAVLSGGNLRQREIGRCKKNGEKCKSEQKASGRVLPLCCRPSLPAK